MGNYRINLFLRGVRELSGMPVAATIGVTARLMSIGTGRLNPRINYFAKWISNFSNFLPKVHQTVLLVLRPEAKISSFDFSENASHIESLENHIFSPVDRSGVLIKLFYLKVGFPTARYCAQGNWVNRHISQRARVVLFAPVELICMIADSILAIPIVPASILMTTLSPTSELAAIVNYFANRQLHSVGLVIELPFGMMSAFVNPYPVRAGMD